MKYIIALHKERNNDYLYRIYVTDSLYYSRTDTRLADRFKDILNAPPADTRTGDEIAEDIIKRHNLRIKTEET